ncbi:MAG: DEAD/DEAH box helicase [Verrucomicrobiae bacterium]|nr:DEAD/DEAH box helicase [Verrucomicrobiae bacterium]
MKDRIPPFLEDGGWRRVFDGGALARGQKLARAKQVTSVSAEVLDTGDVEIVGRIMESDGCQSEAIIALWEDPDADGELAFDAGCSCGVGVNCVHCVALLEYLAKAPGVRLEMAFGGTPQAEKVTQGKHLALDEKTQTNTPPASASDGTGKPTFLLRIERRPDIDRIDWLPALYGHAYATYGDYQVPLEPSGSLPPIVTPERKIPRDRVAEMEAVQTLYALDLRPGAERPPQSLKKLAPAPHGDGGTLWAVDRKEWPHPEFYWQRFRHEGTPALERRGWEVQFSPYVGLKPLIFRTETWRAEIVEEGRGWFSLSAGFEIEGEKFELQPILASLVENRFLEVTAGLPKGQEFMIFLPDGRGLALPVGRFRNILTTLGQLMEFRFTDGPIKLSKLDAALLLQSNNGEDGGGSEAFQLEIDGPDEIEGLAERLTSFQTIDRVPVPEGLKANLRDYQLDGFYWMQFLAHYDLNGILADDMGLGKTLQTLAHLLAEKESGGNNGLPSLVVAPTSVVENWQREAAKFAPDLRVLVLQGADRKTRFSEIVRADLVLTSFALLPRDLEVFVGQTFHLIALDEAQHIKNASTQVNRAACQLRGAHRLCLSGTPIENNLGELWSLMHFLMPGLLGKRETFNEQFRTPIEKDGNAEKSAQLTRRVGPLILRRTKNDVAKELPPKTEIVHTIELNEAQKDLYETVRSTMDKQVREALALTGTESQIVFLDALLKLRQICCHPRLLKNQEHHPDSTKFEYLVELLDTFRQENHRVLVFSQFTSMLAIIEAHLNAIECPYLKLTGETKDRQLLVERFQAGEGDVFLISLKAGGTGLTLTGADTVIHYDPWWNPAAENQATDRAYRIGQDKPVFVHKLICKGTVEQRIQQMQGKKSHLADDLLSGATEKLSLTPETLDQLLGPVE